MHMHLKIDAKILSNARNLKCFIFKTVNSIDDLFSPWLCHDKIFETRSHVNMFRQTFFSSVIATLFHSLAILLTTYLSNKNNLITIFSDVVSCKDYQCLQMQSPKCFDVLVIFILLSCHVVSQRL